MEIATHPSELRALVGGFKRNAQRIGFVPTMGALHEGHVSLVKLASEQAQRTVVSIFVNPTQFGPSEDFFSYPRTPEKDVALLESAGVDVVFMPVVAEMYPEGSAIRVHAGPVGSVFEGAHRPGHFDGVLTIVAKLFHLVEPDVAVFGQKDAQQLFLIRRMVADLDFPVRIVEGETVRESDGLACSSRNAYLAPDLRRKASVLYRALAEGKRRAEQGERSLDRIKSAMMDVLSSVSEFSTDYSTVVSEETFAEEDPIPGKARLIVAGRLGRVRLIDNMPL